MRKIFMPIADDAAQIIVTGDDAHHIGYALRSRVGDKFTVSNTDTAAKTYGCDYICHISAFDAHTVTLDVDEILQSDAESAVRITLYQAVPKSDKFELIVQKCVELGINTIVPVISKRCISRPDEKSKGKKLDRLQKIANEAAKQCGRSVLPEVKDYISFDEAIRDCQSHDCRIICYEGGGIRLNDAITENTSSIALFIGSEGGFDIDEVKKANEAGIVSCTLGKLILRCETAPIAAVSILRNLTGDI